MSKPEKLLKRRHTAEKTGICRFERLRIPFPPIPPNFKGLYLRAQLELCDVSHHFCTGNMMKFWLVTFLGMFDSLKILPKQKHFFFVNFFTLTAVLGYPLDCWSLKCVADLSVFFLIFSETHFCMKNSSKLYSGTFFHTNNSKKFPPAAGKKVDDLSVCFYFWK